MKYSIGIDIGGTNTVFGLVDSKGEIIKTKKISTTSYDNFDSYLSSLSQNIEDLCKQIPNSEVLGVGIGAPNGNHYLGIIDNAPNLKYKGVLEIKKMLHEDLRNKGLNTNVEIDNDANVAAMGEMVFGKAQGVENFIMITLGTGVGKWQISTRTYGFCRRVRAYYNRRKRTFVQLWQKRLCGKILFGFRLYSYGKRKIGNKYQTLTFA